MKYDELSIEVVKIIAHVDTSNEIKLILPLSPHMANALVSIPLN